MRSFWSAAGCCLILAGCLGARGADDVVTDPVAPAPMGDPFLETIVANLTSATQVADVQDALWITERTGTVLRWDGTLETMFDLTDVVGSEGSNQGLQAIAADVYVPGRWYISYTDLDGHGVVARGAGEWEQVLFVPQPDTWHNVGHLAFGPDGMLYIGSGDGGGFGDPYHNGQNASNLLGAILRIDVSEDGAYRVPPDNPFVDGGGAPEVWAWGLRNPWRFDFADDGSIWVADVGNGKMEEVDHITTPGGNYGWPKWEGTHPLQGGGDGYEMPVAAYPRGDETGCAIIGGIVYHGAWFPELQGRFVFTDFCTGTVMYLDNGTIVPLLDTDLRINSVSADASGEILLAADGIYRVGRLP